MDHIVTHINKIKSPGDRAASEDGAFASLVYVSSLENGITRKQGKNGFLL